MEEQSFTLPALGQIGIVVKNIEKSIEYYSRVFGIGPFKCFTFAPEKHWVKGEHFPIELKLAFARIGPVQLELIEPVSDGPHKWLLDENGEGLQHLGFLVENYDAWINHVKQHGIEVLMNVDDDIPGMGHVRAAYLESDDMDGVLIELIESRPRE